MASYEIIRGSNDYGTPLFARFPDGRIERLFEVQGGAQGGYQRAGVPLYAPESEYRQYEGREMPNTAEIGAETFSTVTQYAPATFKFPRNSGWQDTVGELLPVAFMVGATYGIGTLAAGEVTGAASAADDAAAFEGGAHLGGGSVSSAAEAADIAAFEGGAHLGAGASNVSALSQFSSVPEWVSGAGKAIATGVGTGLVNRARSFVENLLMPDAPEMSASTPGAFDPGGESMFIAPQAQQRAQENSSLAWIAIVGAIVFIFALLLKGK